MGLGGSEPGLLGVEEPEDVADTLGRQLWMHTERLESVSKLQRAFSGAPPNVVRHAY